MHPQTERKQPGCEQGEHHQGIGEYRAARERGNDRGHHTQRRDENDVDLGMAEEPEQVLPQQRVAAFRRIVEVRADQAIHDEERARDHHRRHREQHHEAHDQHGPDE
jgi:hypothetical protein